MHIMHNWERKEVYHHAEVRQRARIVLRELVDAAASTHQHKYERNVLHYLEQVRAHTDSLYELLAILKSGQELEEEYLEQLHRVEYTMRKLNAKSCDKQDYCPVLLSLGGLQAVAEIVVIDCKLAHHYASCDSRETVISHPPVVISLALNILVNLTYAGSIMQFLSSAAFASDWTPYLLAGTLVALLLTYLWYR